MQEEDKKSLPGILNLIIIVIELSWLMNTSSSHSIEHLAEARRIR